MSLSKRQAQALGLIPPPREKKKPPITKAEWKVSLIPGGVKFTIPMNMPSLNEWSRWHWAKKKRFLDNLTKALKTLAYILPKPILEKARVEVTHYHRVQRRRDADNQTPKFLLDALRYAGVILDDNHEVLDLLPPRFEIDRECWRTEVLVTEWE